MNLVIDNYDSFTYNLESSKHKGHGKIEGLEEGEEGEYLSDRLTTETLRWMRRHLKESSDKPFFVYLSHYGVHTPLEGPKDWVARYEDSLL